METNYYVAKFHYYKKNILLSSLMFSLSIVLFLIGYLTIRIYNSPKMLILPHQNAVNDLRNDLIQKISTNNPFIKTVIIIGPDHFSQNQNAISYTNREWLLNEGVVSFDHDSKIAKEIKQHYASNEQLKHDHAIYNLLAPINKNFPRALVVPILIGQKVSKERLSDLIQIVDKNCGLQCVIIYSVDFSHSLPYPIADIHDLYSIKTLQNSDSLDADKMEVDSNQSLYIAMELAKRWRLNFNLFANTNSAKLDGNPISESTSHVLGYYARENDEIEINIKTFIYATRIGDQLKKLDARYFYGAESVDLKLEEIKKVRDSLEVIPSKDIRLQIQCIDDNYTILLPADVLLTGYAKGDNIYVIFTPQIMDTNAFKRCASYDKSTHTFVLD